MCDGNAKPFFFVSERRTSEEKEVARLDVKYSSENITPSNKNN
jgi:hypothetical protein